MSRKSPPQFFLLWILSIFVESISVGISTSEICEDKNGCVENDTEISGLPGPVVYVPNLPKSEIDALHALYTATNGDKWNWIHRSSANDNGIPWNFSTNANPCIEHWQGVVCNANCTVSPKRSPSIYCTVTELQLDSYNLNGTLPNELSNLTSLSYLSLARNRIRNPLPDNLFANMTNLVSLDLSGNYLRGTIPDKVYTWPFLQLLDLSRCEFSGTLPSSIFLLPSLLYLDLGGNSISGSLSSDICQLSWIEYILLAFNALTGSIPCCLGKIESIQILSLSYNALTNSIPDTISGLTNIYLLDLSGNYLECQLPQSISELYTLNIINLEKNLFTGEVPSLSKLLDLKFLAMGSNQFEGPVPNVSTAAALSIYQIYSNQFMGNMLSLNTSSLIAVTVDCNYITGTIPSVVNDSRVLMTDTLKEDLLKLEPFVDDGEFIKRLVNFNVTTNMLFYVNFSQNAFSGRVPDWIFTSPLLTYVYMYDNVLSGTIPDIPTNITWIGVLYLDNNFLTGTIPRTILQQQYLVNLRLSDNQLTGTISPEIFNSPFLTEVGFEDNKFTGPLPTLPAQTIKSYPDLSILTFSNNEFTGLLDASFFTSLPSLEIFAASSNCLIGYIPEEICEAKMLRQLILDGMSSAEQCRSFIFPRYASGGDYGSAWFNSFVVGHGMQGSIPSCLLRMPNLQSLYLSGNELKGSIPTNVNISKSLINLRLSYNRLTGSIPAELQLRSWNILDLSYNKLSGHLLSDFNPTPVSNESTVVVISTVSTGSSGNGVVSRNNTDITIALLDNSSSVRTLYLDVNRLSGKLPVGLREIQDISVLNGNIFFCDFSREQLPLHDPKYHSYSCGSNSVNQAFFSWMIPFVLVALLIMLLKYRANRQNQGFREMYLLPLLRDIQLYYHAFKMAASGLIDTHPPPNSVALNHEDSKNHQHLSKEPQREIPAKYDEKITLNSNVHLAFAIAREFFSRLQKYCCIIALILIIVLMPTFRVLNIFASTFENKYAWAFSAIYVSGYVSGAILFIAFASIIALVYYWLDLTLYHLLREKLVRNFPRRKNMGHEIEIKPLTDDSDAFVSDSCTTISQHIAVADNQQAISTSGHMNAEQDKRIESKRWFSCYFCFQNKQILILILVGLINATLITLINTAYVIIVVYVKNQYLIIMSQFCLAIIKLWWNDVFLWQLLGWVKGLVHKRWNDQNSQVAWQQGDLLADTKSFLMTSNDMFFLVCALLFNNVLAPCVSIAVVSPSCFYNLFVAAAPLSATYRYCDVYIMITRNRGFCYSFTEGTTTFAPPFIYSYNCASFLPVNYIAVYMYMAFISGFVIPSLKLSMKFINENTSFGTNESSIVFKLMDRYMSPAFKKLQPHPYQLCSSSLKKFSDSRRIVDKDILMLELMKDHLPQNRKAFALKLRAMRPMFDKNRLVIRIVGLLALMVSFGVVFPPLALLLCAAICSIICFEQFNIGRVLYQSEQLGYHWYRQKIAYDLEGLVEIFIPAILPMTFVAGLLFASLIFDTFGDQHGHRVAVIPAICMVFVPGCIWLIVRVDWSTMRSYLLERNQTRNERPRSMMRTIELRNFGTIENPLHNHHNNASIDEDM